MTTHQPSRLAGLDTLRALAITVVIVFHLQEYLPPVLLPVAAVGWMGVDLFFVLSGYLIGSQLLKPYLRGHRPSLRAFYARRAYRILPAYLTVLLLYATVPFWREHPGLPALWKLLTFTANLVLNFPAQTAFSHVWSLCVEEHFYLLLPLLVLVFMRRPSVGRTFAALGLVVLFGIGLRAFELFHVVHGVRAPGVADEEAQILFMKRIYYPTWTRLDGLLDGVALALVRVFRPDWWRVVAHRGNSLLVLGVLVTGGAVALFHGAYPDPGKTAAILFGFPLLSLGLALLVASTTCRNGLLRRPAPGARLLATLAFSLYLSHKGVAHAMQHFFPWLAERRSWSAAGVYAAACLAFAGLLYLAVERPFLLLREQRSRGTGSAPSHAESHAEKEARLDPAL